MRLWLFTVGLLGLPGVALGQQTDYSAGKTPAQLFSSDCSACHSTVRGLAKGRDQRSLAGFLREHYTTKQETAVALAGFLAGAPAGPAAEPRNPGEPRGRQAAPPPQPSGQQSATPAARVRPPGAIESEDTAIAAPEGGAARRPAREAAKPSPRGRKQDAAAAAEAARAAEEAEKEAVRAKVRAYATVGEEARPKIAPAPATAAPAPPAASDTDSKVDTPKAETPKADTPKTETASPGEGSKSSDPASPAPSGEENRSRTDAPAGSPPG